MQRASDETLTSYSYLIFKLKKKNMAAPFRVQDLSSPTRDGAQAHCGGSWEA